MNIDDGLMEKIAIIDALAREGGTYQRSVAVVYVPGDDGKPGAFASGMIVARRDVPVTSQRLVDAEFVTFDHADPQAALEGLVASIQGVTQARAEKAVVFATVAADRDAAVKAEAGKIGK